MKHVFDTLERMARSNHWFKQHWHDHTVTLPNGDVARWTLNTTTDPPMIQSPWINSKPVNDHDLRTRLREIDHPHAAYIDTYDEDGMPCDGGPRRHLYDQHGRPRL